MKLRISIAATLLGLLASGTTQAQGIPVIDAANLVQAVQQVVDSITQIKNQVQQITQLQSQLDSINGARNLGRISDSPMLRNYIPPQAYGAVNGVDTSGYAGLTGTGKALRDAAVHYNCLDLAGTARTACQAALAQPYQYKGLLQDAMKAAAGRLSQVDALMNEINATRDQKAIQELQARIGAESVLLAHEASQIQMLQAMADTDERIARSRDRERQYEVLNRAGKIADYLR
jgi:type IV secretion system protein VirB5